MLTADANIQLTGGDQAYGQQLQASEIPFVGSALVHALDGYVEVLDSTSKGQPFAGFAEQRVLSTDHPTSPADGDIVIATRRGIFLAVLTLTGVALDDVAHGRLVFASDDGTFTFTASGNTLIGQVVGTAGTNKAIVLCATADYQGVLGAAVAGVKTMAATGNQALTTADLGKLILVPNTAALTITLPAAADCTGRKLTVKKTTADAQVVTLDGADAETIDGATTSTVIDAAQDTLTIVSDGSGWHIIASKIA